VAPLELSAGWFCEIKISENGAITYFKLHYVNVNFSVEKIVHCNVKIDKQLLCKEST
jgi:hypothetical protein